MLQKPVPQARSSSPRPGPVSRGPVQWSCEPDIRPCRPCPAGRSAGYQQTAAPSPMHLNEAGPTRGEPAPDCYSMCPLRACGGGQRTYNKEMMHSDTLPICDAYLNTLIPGTRGSCSRPPVDSNNYWLQLHLVPGIRGAKIIRGAQITITGLVLSALSPYSISPGRQLPPISTHMCG